MTEPPTHSSRWAGLKGYISQCEIHLSRPSTRSSAAAPEQECHTLTRSVIQSWNHWAGHKVRSNSSDVATVDEVHLVPGWATKCPPTPDQPHNAFNVEIHISGFATSRRKPEILTRSQRAFLKLARGFASIPKLQPTLNQLDAELQDFPELLHLPPHPDEISDDYEVENLDTHFQNSGYHNNEVDDVHFTPHVLPADPIPAELARLHENLESRLKLFWASSLSSRRIHIAVFPLFPGSKCHHHRTGPLLNQEMLTGPDGHFAGTLRIDWNDIYMHPPCTCNASNQTNVESELLVEASIIDTERASGLHETPTSTIRTPITHSIMRVISDIDDTVKISRITEGARAIFNQVFVKNVEDTIIPEMGEWYDTMWKRGVSFHYVSNSPFELLPVINQFISISNLPPGSIRLRSYTGRSLFNGLLSAPAARKRGNVVDVLEQFSGCQFLLIGDSGEQDLELYSSLAADRPGQIVGIFIRDVCAVGLENPTGIRAGSISPMKPRSRGTLPSPSNLPSRIVPKRAASDTDVSPAHPGAIRIPRPPKKGSLSSSLHSSDPSPDPKFLSRVSEDSSSSIASTGSSTSSSLPSARQVRFTTEGERKRWDLQTRVNKARLMIPPHIVLRVFENPKECVEAAEIIQHFMNVP